MKKKCFFFYIAAAVVIIASAFFLFGCARHDNAHRLVFRSLHKDTAILTLPNGLTLVTEKKSDVPLVALSLTVNAGLLHEAGYTGSGISHYIEHMVFKGNKNYTQEKMNLFLRGIGADINAFTTRDYTTYSVTIPKEYLAETLRMLAEITLKPDFPEEELEKERKVIASEIQFREDNPYEYGLKKIWAVAFRSHPYRFPIIGEKELLMRLTRNDLVSYHALTYRPSRMVLAIAGDIDHQTAIEEVARTFGAYTADPIATPLPLPEPTSIEPVLVEEPLPLQNTYLIMAFKSTSCVEKEGIALDVVASALSDGEHARLNTSLKDKGIVYQCESANITPAHRGLFIVSCVLEYEQIPAAVKKILGEIEAIKNKGVTTQEFEKNKNSLYARLLREFQNIEGIAGDLSNNFSLTQDPYFMHAYLKRLAEMTNEDVQTAARRYLGTDGLSIMILRPNDKRYAVDAVKDLRAILGLGEESAQENIVQKFTLKNGLRVLLKEDHRLPMVYTALVSLSGVRYETEKNNGIADLSAKILNKGLVNNGSFDIASSIEQRGGDFRAFAGNNTLIASVDIPRADFSFALDALGRVVKDCFVSEKDLEIEKNIMYAEQKAQKDDPFEYGIIELRKLLFKGHPYHLNPKGSEESVKSIRVAAVKRFIRESFDPRDSVAVIFGDINAKEALAEATKKFGNLISSKVTHRIQEPLLDAQREKIVSLAKREALVLRGYLTSPLRSPERHVFEVTKEYLDGIGGKLYEGIREQYGDSYSLGALQIMGPEKGYYVLYVYCPRERIDSVEAFLKNTVKSLQEQGIPDEDLAHAKQIVKTNFLRRQQSQEGLALQCALDELFGLGYDDFTRYMSAIEGVTKQDIIDTLRVYFDDDVSRTVKVVPQDSN